MVRTALSIATLALFASLAACAADTDESKKQSDEIIKENSSAEPFEGVPGASENVGVEISPRPFVEKQKAPAMAEASRVGEIQKAAEPPQSGKKD